MKLVAFLLLLLLLGFPPTVFASQWYYPMDKYFERQTVKGFGQLIDDNFYKGKEQLFPYNRFYGYHAGVDLESFPDEQNKLVPVYAVSSGTITYIGSLSGYGGVILEKLDNENHTALYGHVKIKSLSYKVGDQINSGQTLTYLGEGFSDETGKERKHLHFAIHKGVDLYFHGHEESLQILATQWENPNDYLKASGAVSPSQSPTPSAKSTTSPNPTDFFHQLITTIKSLLQKIFAVRAWRQILLYSMLLKL